MEHVGPNVMHSLADAESGACGFRPYVVTHGIGIAAEWSHSLNMLDLNISSMYQEVCERDMHVKGEDVGGVDVLVLCDRKQIFIVFLANLRNRTQYTVVDTVSTFYRKQGMALSQIVINADVWEAIVHSGVQVLLHMDKNSTSCSFQFIEPHGQAKSYTLATHMGLVLCLFLLMLGLLVALRVVWGPVDMAICQYISTAFNVDVHGLCR